MYELHFFARTSSPAVPAAWHEVIVFVEEIEFHLACKYVKHAVHRLDTREVSLRRLDNTSLAWDRSVLFFLLFSSFLVSFVLQPPTHGFLQRGHDGSYQHRVALSWYR